MSLTRWLALACLATALLAAKTAPAACPAIADCSLPDPLAGCCTGNTCTLTGTITPTASTCDLNFGARNVTLTGTLNVGTRTVTIEAGSFRVNGGLLDAHGNAGSAGGNVTITTTGGGVMGYALRLDGGGATGITLTGFARGGGSLLVDADGPVVLVGGHIDAGGSEAGAGGGSILIESTAGAITVGAPVLADGGQSGFGGFVSLKGAGDLTVTDTGRISTRSGLDGGSISLEAAGALLVSGAALVRANGLDNSGDSGGEVSLTGGSVRIEGTVQASGGDDASGDAGGDGGAIDIEARTGALVLTGAPQALTADAAGGGDGGEINLVTDSPTNGNIQVDSVVSAHATGGLAGRPGGGGTVEADAAAGFESSRLIDVTGKGGATGLADLSAQRDVTINATIDGSDPAGGGSVSVVGRHDVILNGLGTTRNFRMNATTSGPGGEIEVSAGNDLRITSFQLDVSALGPYVGGSITADAGRNLTVDADGTLNANSRDDAAGGISLTAGLPDLAGNLQIDGQVTARGHSLALAAVPASILLAGCQVTISNRGTVDCSGDPGTFNRVTGRTGITVAGTLRATQNNTAVFRTGFPPTGIGPGGGTVSPAFTQTPAAPCTAPNVPAGCLMPCPTCGDSAQQFPEQCDPPGCPTCDLHCRLLVPASCATGNSCAVDSCDAIFGCVSEPKSDGTGCDDANPCTRDDVCHTGSCLGTPVIPAIDCDDGNACTRNECSPAMGGCVHPPVVCTPDPNLCFMGSVCDPASGCHPGPPRACSTGEVCDPGTGDCRPKPCPNGAADCNDGNPCTADTCVTGFCNSAPVPDGVTPGCGDANPCNGAETCAAGVCTPGAPPTCDDSNLCTVDTCDSVLGCRHTAIPGCCRDVNDCPGHNICTVCDPDSHTCGSMPDCCTGAVGVSECDDGNVCTNDSCAANHCNHTGVQDRACGDNCNPGTCQADMGRTCVLGTPVTCPPDPDPCHRFRCDPTVGACVNPPIDGCCVGNADCDDHNNCTDDVCTEGHQCTNNPKFAECKSCATDLDCDPLGACAGEQCGAGGVCVAVSAPECDNRRPNFRGTCVLDASGAPSCQYLCVLNSACDDHDACNGAETCDAGAGSCVAGTPLDCDDHDSCTDDSCNGATGCVHSQTAGFPSVVCRLDAMDADLAAAGADAITPATKTKLSSLVQKARSKLAAAQTAGQGKRALKALKATGKQLKAIGKAVQAAVKKRKIKDPTLADRLLKAATDGGAALETLKTSVTP